MSIQLFGNNIRIAQESSIAVRLNSDNTELWKHRNFCMCVTEVWSQGQVHAGHILYLLLVPPPPSLLIIFEIEPPRLVLSSLCLSGGALIYAPTASASPVAGNSSLCFTVTPPEWNRNEGSGRSFPGHSRESFLWSALDQGALGHAKKDCFLCSRCWLCCPCCETEAPSAWRHRLLPVYQSGALIFLSLACALELPLGKR